MDRLEDLLRRIRDPRECTELLLDAPRAGARGVARQVAAVLSSLPAAHRELDAAPAHPAAVDDTPETLAAAPPVVVPADN